MMKLLSYLRNVWKDSYVGIHFFEYLYVIKNIRFCIIKVHKDYKYKGGYNCKYTLVFEKLKPLPCGSTGYKKKVWVNLYTMYFLKFR